MGKKGVSKRKPSQTKKPAPSTGKPNEVVLSTLPGSEAPAARFPGKGETVSSGKGGNKK